MIGEAPHLKSPKHQQKPAILLIEVGFGAIWPGQPLPDQPGKSTAKYLSVEPLRMPRGRRPTKKSALFTIDPTPPRAVQSLHRAGDCERINGREPNSHPIQTTTAQPLQPSPPSRLDIWSVLIAGRQHRQARPQHSQLQELPPSGPQLHTVEMRDVHRPPHRLLVAAGQKANKRRLPAFGGNAALHPAVHDRMRGEGQVAAAPRYRQTPQGLQRTANRGNHIQHNAFNFGLAIRIAVPPGGILI